MGQYNEAVRAYDNAINKSPKYASVWNNRGIALAALNKYEEALKCFDKAKEMNPFLKEAFYNKGLLLFELGLYEDAIEAFDKAVEVYENVLNIYEKLIETSYENIRKKPDGKPIVARTLEAINNIDPKILEAISAYDKVVERNRSIPNMTLAKYWFSKGITLSEIGLYDKATKAYDKAIELYPTFFLSFIGKGKAFADSCQDTKALEIYLSLIDMIAHLVGLNTQSLMALEPENRSNEFRIPPEFSLVLNCIGELYNQLELYDQAVGYLRKATSWNPRLATAWENLGIAFIGLRKYENATKIFDKALESDPSLASAYYYKCITIMKADKIREPKGCFEPTFRVLKLEVLNFSL